MNNISFNKNYLIYLSLSIIFYCFLYDYSIGSGVLTIDNDYYGILRGFPSDTNTYLSVAINESFDTYHRNIGPGFVLYIFDQNLFLIFFTQFIFYQFFIYKLYKINKSSLFLFFSFLPILTLSTLFPNKDLYTILFYACLILYSVDRKNLWIIVAIILTFFSRPELIAFLVLFIILSIKKKYFYYVILILIFLISIIYQDIYRMDEYRLVLERGVSLENSIALLIDNLSRDYYIYFIIWPLKILASIIDGNFFNIALFSSLLLVAFKNYKINENYILLILALLYGTITSFPHFRYILPIYIILFHIIGLSMNSSKISE